MFIYDRDKMIDFSGMSKDSFMASYSYLFDKDYEDTLNYINSLHRDEITIEYNSESDEWELLEIGTGNLVSSKRTLIELINDFNILR